MLYYVITINSNATNLSAVNLRVSRGKTIPSTNFRITSQYQHLKSLPVNIRTPCHSGLPTE